MTTGPLSGADIRRLFVQLAEELSGRGVRAELFLVGGAAIALCFDERRATRDLDAVFAPTDAVRRAAAAVAEREGLEPDWLNDAVKGFLPGKDRRAVSVLRSTRPLRRRRITGVPARDETLRIARRDRRRGHHASLSPPWVHDGRARP